VGECVGDDCAGEGLLGFWVSSEGGNVSRGKQERVLLRALCGIRSVFRHSVEVRRSTYGLEVEFLCRVFGFRFSWKKVNGW